MIGPEDREFARIAIESGAVDARAVEACMTEIEDSSRDDGGPTLADLLVERGHVTRDRCEDLVREMSRRPLPQPIPGYELISLRGRGGMGAVYRARQLGTDRFVALKILRSPEGSSPRRVERLRREASLLARLDHPNIVKGYDAGEAGGYTYFAMEFVEGASVKECLRKKGRFDEPEAVRIAIQIASALEHADSLGVVHRDVKPGNIMIGPDGFAKLTDLGLAKSAAEMTLTRSGATVGTPRYLSPEQARDPRRVDIRSDIYSLGATLYEMVTGEPPFHGDSIGSVVAKVLFSEPVPATRLRTDLSARFARVLDRTMAKAPADRYQSAAELLIDLRRLQAGEPPLAPRLRPRIRRRLLLGGAGSLAVAAAALVVALRAGAPEPPLEDGAGPAGGLEAVQLAFERGRDARNPRETLEALSELRVLAAAHAGRPAGNAASARADDLERLLRDDIGAFVSTLERAARARIDASADRDGALALVGDAVRVAEAFRGRYGIAPDELPEAERLKAADSLAAAQSLVARAAGESAFEEARTLVARAMDRSASVAERADLAARARARIDDVLSVYMDGKAAARAAALAAEASEAAALDVRNEFAPRIDAVRRGAGENRFASARAGLAALERENWQRFLPDLAETIEDVRASLLAREEALRRQLASELAAFRVKRDRRHASRDFHAVRDDAELLVAILESAVLEFPDLEPMHREARAAKRESEAILALYRRAGSFIGRERAAFKLRGDPAEKTATGFESDVIRYVQKPSRDERRASVFDLPASALRPLTGDTAEECAKIILMVDDAESTRELEVRKGMLADARRMLFALRAEGAEDPAVARAGLLLERAEEGLEGAQGEKLEAAEKLLAAADAAFDRGEFAEASASYRKLRDTAAFREVYRRERVRVDERIALAAAEEESAALAALFGGAVETLDAAQRTIRVTYDFELEGALDGFEPGDPKKWSVSGGRLRFSGADPSANTLHGAAGLALAAVQDKRAQFDLLKDFAFEMTYTPSPSAPPGFIAVSLFGNNFGCLSRRQTPDPRAGQLNVWKGSLEDYESEFFFALMDSRAPAGLVEHSFEPGRRSRIRLEIRDRGARFAVKIDDRKPLEFTISEPRRDRKIEIRSWHAAEFDDIRLEGTLRR